MCIRDSIVDEAHVEHAVGLVEHNGLDIVELDGAALHVVAQASRRNLGMFSATISREVMDISWMYQRDPEEITVQAKERCV